MDGRWKNRWTTKLLVLTKHSFFCLSWFVTTAGLVTFLTHIGGYYNERSFLKKGS